MDEIITTLPLNKTSLPKEDWPGRFDEEQYDLLMMCSKKHDFREWEKNRRKLRRKPIPLEGANLFYVFKKGNINYVIGAYFEGVNLVNANLKGAQMPGANLKRAIMILADLTGADLSGGEPDFSADSYLGVTNLNGARLSGANISGAIISNADLRHAIFRNAKVDKSTIISICYTDDKTIFSNVDLSVARVTQQFKLTMEANERRLWWKNSYYSRKRPFSTAFAWLFWLLSDYGRSTWRIIISFFVSALIFTVIYASKPSMIYELIPKEGESVWLPLRAFYFSVVTMTTLGFGDMHAAQDSIDGHIWLMLHVIIGYVLLGALIVRIGTLFTSVPPEHKEPPAEKKEE